MITAARMTSSIRPFASGFVASTCSTTPMSVATPTANPKLENWVIAVAARPRISSSGPSDSG